MLFLSFVVSSLTKHHFKKVRGLGLKWTVLERGPAVADIYVDMLTMYKFKHTDAHRFKVVKNVEHLIVLK